MKTKPIETVTISIETYQNMKDRIMKLERENESKTIYKDVLHPVYGHVAIVFMILVLLFMFMMPEII